MSDELTTVDDRDRAIKYSGTWSFAGDLSTSTLPRIQLQLGLARYSSFLLVCTPFSLFSLPRSPACLLLYSISPTYTSYLIGTSISVYRTIIYTGLGAQPISNYTNGSGVPYRFAASLEQGEDQHQQLFFRTTA